jgi:hypothetical protein
MNEALYRLPLLCRVVEDGYGRSCGFSWLMSKLEPEPPMSESSPRKVVHNAYMSRRFSEEQDVDMESVVDFHF